MDVRKIYLINYLQRIVNALGGMVVIYIISSLYNIDEADKFYSIFSLMGLIALYEFGYATLIVQRISYYSIDKNKTKVNYSYDIKHYMSIVNVLSIITFISFPIIGFFFIDWKSIAYLYLISFLLAVNLKFTMSINIMEGLGYLESVAKTRLLQAVSSYFAMSVFLLLGFGYHSVIFQLLAQIFVIVPLCFFYYKKHTILPVLSESFSLSSVFRSLKIKIFSRDVNYSFQLYLTAISTIFTNQIWVLALSVVGVANVSKYAISLQVIAACAGFALTPIASRLSHLAKMNHLGNTELKRKLIVQISKDIILATLLGAIGVCMVYWYAYLYYNDRVLNLDAACIMLTSLPIIITVSLMGIIVQSKGKRDMIFVSLVKIIVPIFIFYILDNDTSEMSVAYYYLLFNLVSLFIASIYFFKEIK